MSESKRTNSSTTTLKTRVEGLDEKGRPRLLRVFYDEDVPVTRKFHRVVKVEGKAEDFKGES